MKFKVFKSDLEQAIKLTKAFTSKSNKRPILKAVHIEAAADKVTFIATDIFKLVMHELKAPAATVVSEGFCNIDIAQLDKILKIFKYKTPVEVELEAKADKLTINFEGYSFTLFLIIGVYPNFDRVIPKQENYTADVLSITKDNIAPVISALANGTFIDIKINKRNSAPALFEISNNNKLVTTKAIILPVKRI